MIGYTPQGPTMFRNPPAQHFKPPQNMDLPLFAHDGRGKSLVGEWTNGEHGEQIYNTELGSFQHGIDALVSHLGDFLRRNNINRSPVDVINQAQNNSMLSQIRLINYLCLIIWLEKIKSRNVTTG